jgi:hypothetical protein
MQVLPAQKYQFSLLNVPCSPPCCQNAAASIPTATALVRSHLNAFLSAFGSAFTPARSASSSSSSSSMPAAGADAAGLVQPPPLTPQAAAARRMPLDSVDSSAASTGKSAAASTAIASTSPTARLRVGDRVRVALPAGQTQPRYKWGAAVTAESIGTVRRIDADGDAIVSFGADAPSWRALAAELQVVAADGSSASALAAEPLRVGARVRVVLPAGRDQPAYRWGSHVNAQSIGTLRSLNGSEARVDFPGAPGWMALASELQVAAEDAEPVGAAAESESEEESEEDEEEEEDSDQTESETSTDSDGDSDF